MPIKWSALKVSEAAGVIEEYLKQAVEPLQQALVVAREARKIANLPQYVDQDFGRIIGEIGDCLGGTQFRPVGWFKTVIENVRKDIPSSAVEAEESRQKYGSQQSLV